VDLDTLGLYSAGRRRWTMPDMDTSLHSHITAIHIQERMDRAAGERLARSVRPPRRRRRPTLRLTTRRRVGKVVAGS
jgi:hypothetical protein